MRAFFPAKDFLPANMRVFRDSISIWKSVFYIFRVFLSSLLWPENYAFTLCLWPFCMVKGMLLTANSYAFTCSKHSNRGCFYSFSVVISTFSTPSRSKLSDSEMLKTPRLSWQKNRIKCRVSAHFFDIKTEIHIFGVIRHKGRKRPKRHI